MAPSGSYPNTSFSLENLPILYVCFTNATTTGLSDYYHVAAQAVFLAFVCLLLCSAKPAIRIVIYSWQRKPGLCLV